MSVSTVGILNSKYLRSTGPSPGFRRSERIGFTIGNLNCYLTRLLQVAPGCSPGVRVIQAMYYGTLGESNICFADVVTSVTINVFICGAGVTLVLF